MGPMIPKQMKYNLHYGDVRGDVVPPPLGTNTSCSVKTYNKTCLTSKVSDQPIHPTRMAKVLVHSSLDNSGAVKSIRDQQRH